MTGNKELVKEISDLKKEIRELKDVVNMLVEMVMNTENDEIESGPVLDAMSRENYFSMYH